MAETEYQRFLRLTGQTEQESELDRFYRLTGQARPPKPVAEGVENFGTPPSTLGARADEEYQALKIQLGIERDPRLVNERGIPIVRPDQPAPRAPQVFQTRLTTVKQPEPYDVFGKPQDRPTLPTVSPPVSRQGAFSEFPEVLVQGERGLEDPFGLSGQGLRPPPFAEVRSETQQRIAAAYDKEARMLQGMERGREEGLALAGERIGQVVEVGKVTWDAGFGVGAVMDIGKNLVSDLARSARKYAEAQRESGQPFHDAVPADLAASGLETLAAGIGGLRDVGGDVANRGAKFVGASVGQVFDWAVTPQQMLHDAGFQVVSRAIGEAENAKAYAGMDYWERIEQTGTGVALLTGRTPEQHRARIDAEPDPQKKAQLQIRFNEAKAAGLFVEFVFDPLNVLGLAPVGKVGDAVTSFKLLGEVGDAGNVMRVIEKEAIGYTRFGAREQIRAVDKAMTSPHAVERAIAAGADAAQIGGNPEAAIIRVAEDITAEAKAGFADFLWETRAKRYAKDGHWINREGQRIPITITEQKAAAVEYALLVAQGPVSVVLPNPRSAFRAVKELIPIKGIGAPPELKNGYQSYVLALERLTPMLEAAIATNAYQSVRRAINPAMEAAKFGVDWVAQKAVNPLLSQVDTTRTWRGKADAAITERFREMRGLIGHLSEPAKRQLALRMDELGLAPVEAETVATMLEAEMHAADPMIQDILDRVRNDPALQAEFDAAEKLRLFVDNYLTQPESAGGLGLSEAQAFVVANAVRNDTNPNDPRLLQAANELRAMYDDREALQRTMGLEVGKVKGIGYIHRTEPNEDIKKLLTKQEFAEEYGRAGTPSEVTKDKPVFDLRTGLLSKKGHQHSRKYRIVVGADGVSHLISSNKDLALRPVELEYVREHWTRHRQMDIDATNRQLNGTANSKGLLAKLDELDTLTEGKTLEQIDGEITRKKQAVSKLLHVERKEELRKTEIERLEGQLSEARLALRDWKAESFGKTPKELTAEINAHQRAVENLRLASKQEQRQANAAKKLRADLDRLELKRETLQTRLTDTGARPVNELARELEQEIRAVRPMLNWTKKQGELSEELAGLERELGYVTDPAWTQVQRYGTKDAQAAVEAGQFTEGKFGRIPVAGEGTRPYASKSQIRGIRTRIDNLRAKLSQGYLDAEGEGDDVLSALTQLEAKRTALAAAKAQVKVQGDPFAQLEEVDATLATLRQMERNLAQLPLNISNEDIIKANRERMRELEGIRRGLATTETDVRRLEKQLPDRTQLSLDISTKEVRQETQKAVAEAKKRRTEILKRLEIEKQAGKAGEKVGKLESEIEEILNALDERMPEETTRLHMKRGRAQASKLPDIGEQGRLKDTNELITVEGYQKTLDPSGVEQTQAVIRRADGSQETRAVSAIRGERNFSHLEFYSEKAAWMDEVISEMGPKTYDANGVRQVVDYMDESSERIATRLFFDSLKRDGYAFRAAVNPDKLRYVLIDEKYGLKELEGFFVETKNATWLGEAFHPSVVNPADLPLAPKLVYNAIKSYNRLFKAFVTSVFPGFNVQNHVSNAWLSYLNIGEDAVNPVVRAQASMLVKMNHRYVELERVALTGKTTFRHMAGNVAQQGAATLFPNPFRLAPSVRRGEGAIRSTFKGELSREQAGALMKNLRETVIFKDAAGRDVTFGEIRETLMKNDIAFSGTSTGYLDLDNPVNADIKAARYGKDSMVTNPYVRAGTGAVAGFAVGGPLGAGVGAALGTGIAQKFGRAVAVDVEDFGKVVNVVGNLRRTGGDWDAAINRTREFLFDYQDLTPFERYYMRELIPFWTFQKKNLVLQTKAVIQKPHTVSFQAHFADWIQHISGEEPLTEEERRDMPDWQQEGTGIPIKRFGDGSMLVLDGFGQPIQSALKTVRDFVGIADSGEGAGRVLQPFSTLTPAIRVPAEVATGTKFYSGGRIPASEDVTDLVNLFEATLPSWTRDLLYGLMQPKEVSAEGYPLTTKKPVRFKGGPELDAGMRFAAQNPRWAYVIRNLPVVQRILSEHRKFTQMESTQEPGGVALWELGDDENRARWLEFLTGMNFTRITQADKDRFRKAVGEESRRTLRREERTREIAPGLVGPKRTTDDYGELVDSDDAGPMQGARPEFDR